MLEDFLSDLNAADPGRFSTLWLAESQSACYFNSIHGP